MSRLCFVLSGYPRVTWPFWLCEPPCRRIFLLHTAANEREARGVGEEEGSLLIYSASVFFEAMRQLSLFCLEI